MPPARLKAARPGLRHVCVLCAASHAPATACHPGATRATAPEEESEWLALCTPMQPMQAALWTLGGGRHARMGGRSPPTPVPPGATRWHGKKKKEACPKDFFFFFFPSWGRPTAPWQAGVQPSCGVYMLHACPDATNMPCQSPHPCPWEPPTRRKKKSFRAGSFFFFLPSGGRQGRQRAMGMQAQCRPPGPMCTPVSQQQQRGMARGRREKSRQRGGGGRRAGGQPLGRAAGRFREGPRGLARARGGGWQRLAVVVAMKSWQSPL